jgi:NCS2 family nucleobase:cation symporter-2
LPSPAGARCRRDRARAHAGPAVAPRWTQRIAHNLHPLLESGIVLAALSAVLLNLFFNGARTSLADAVQAAKVAEAH